MKRTILIVALSVAFAAVSLWLILSGGRSKRATNLKYRLGGMLIGLTALASTACQGGEGDFPPMTCYDPAPPVENEHHWNMGVANSELRNGDVVVLNYECMFGEEILHFVQNDKPSAYTNYLRVSSISPSSMFLPVLL